MARSKNYVEKTILVYLPDYKVFKKTCERKRISMSRAIREFMERFNRQNADKS